MGNREIQVIPSNLECCLSAISQVRGQTSEAVSNRRPDNGAVIPMEVTGPSGQETPMELSASGSSSSSRRPYGVPRGLWRALEARYNPSQLEVLRDVCQKVSPPPSPEASSASLTSSKNGGEDSEEADRRDEKVVSKCANTSGLFQRKQDMSISLIQGPAGTGKTSTVRRNIHFFVKTFLRPHLPSLYSPGRQIARNSVGIDLL